MKNAYKKIKNSRYFLLAKIGVSVALMSFIFYQCDWQLALRTAQTIEPFFLLFVFMCMVGGVFISAYKWQVLLSVHNINLPLAILNRYYFIAVFLNNFLPSSIGGDGFRIYKTAKDSASMGYAVAAVLIERISGVWVLIFLGFLGGLCIDATLPGMPYFSTILWGVGGILLLSGGSVIALYVLSERYSASPLPPSGWLGTLLNWMHNFRLHPAKSVQVVSISFVFQLYALSWMLLLARAVGADISIYNLAVAMMISNMAAMLPVSLNGLGLMDGSFIYIVSLMGMEYEHAVMMMLIMRVFLIFLSVIGCYFYVHLKTLCCDE